MVAVAAVFRTYAGVHVRPLHSADVVHPTSSPARHDAEQMLCVNDRIVGYMQAAASTVPVAQQTMPCAHSPTL